VKSGYHYIMENLVDSSEYRVEGNWKMLWNMKIPQRMKVFLWRAARGCLPTRQRLQQRVVNCTDKCEYCTSNYENEWHIFFSCQKAQEVWEIASLWGMISGEFGTADGFKSLFFHMLEQLEQDQLIAFVTGLWCIWKRRNDKIWEDKEIRPEIAF